MFIEQFEEIMKAFKCDFNHAVKMYERAMNWEESL
jgi:hypothetical protein